MKRLLKALKGWLRSLTQRIGRAKASAPDDPEASRRRPNKNVYPLW